MNETPPVLDVVDALRRSVEALGETAVSEPQTAFAGLDEKVERLLEPLGDELTPSGAVALVIGLETSGVLPDLRRTGERVCSAVRQDAPTRWLVQHARAALRTDAPRTRALLQPFAGIQWMSHALRPMAMLDTARTEHGERRAYALMTAFSRIVATAYEPALRAVWQMDRLAKGNESNSGPSEFGSLVRQMIEHIPGSEVVVDQRSPLFRNAAAHETWEYIPATDDLVLWDRKIPRQRHAATSLIDAAMELYKVGLVRMHDSAVYCLALRMYFGADFLDAVIQDRARILAVATPDESAFITDWIEARADDFKRVSSIVE